MADPSVKRHFSGVVKGDVVRYEMPNIGALNFVMHKALGGGVTRTLALDRSAFIRVNQRPKALAHASSTLTESSN
jgi:uncharacterized membrane protein YeiH